MQDLGAVTLPDLMGRGQELLYKFEVYDGATWINLANRIPADGLVGYWSFDEGSGTAAYDHSSYMTHGTLYNMDAADHVAGKFGNALDFDGSNDYVDVADAAHLDITAAISISVWVKPASIPAWATVISKGTSSSWNTNNYVLGLASGRVDFRWNGKGTCLVDVGDALVAGAWAHVVCVAEPGTTNALKVYINGVLKKQADRTGDPTPNTQALRFGTDNGTDDFPGLIDEARIYNRALTTDEITALGCPLKNSYLKDLSFSLGGAGVSPDPIAGTWSATIANDDGIFHPRHPTSEFSGLLRVGRKVRISVGGKYGGVEYYWQRLIGYMDAPKFETTARSVSLFGGDYMKPLTDTLLASPNNYWGTSQTFSSVETHKHYGVELYVEEDALDPAFEEDVITDWDGLNVTASSVDDAGYGSAYVMQIVKDTSTADGWEGNDAAATLVNGSIYEVTFGYHRTAGAGTLRCLVYPTMTLDQMGQLTGLVADVWTEAKFHFTSTTSGAARLRFYITDPGASTTFRIDSLSIKEVTARLNTRYPMPSTCNGVYLVELDGVPLWYGSDGAGWLYDSANQVFYFADTVWVETGTSNLVVYYFTTQDIVDVLGDVLMASGLYATRVAALAALSYTDPGIDILKAWFETGTKALGAVRLICERCGYRFWFDETGVPHFQPAPTHGDAVAWFSARTVADSGDFQDLEEIRNRIIIEGIEQGAFSTAKDKKTSRLTCVDTHDDTSITAYLEKTHSITNDLFQDQASLDAAAAALLAAFKDPKLYSDLRVPFNPIPIERGDTVEWDIELRPSASESGSDGLKNTVSGIVRDISFAGGEFNYKCEMESGAMNIANYAAGPVTVTAEHCKNWALTNSGAAGDVHFDLPAATVGMRITFYVLAAQTLTVDPNGTDRIAVLTGTAGDYLRSDNVIGSYIILVCFAAGFWHKVDFIGTWAEE